MENLIERLEKASGPDREIDFDIHLARGLNASKSRRRDGQGSWLVYDAYDEGGYGLQELPSYTSSIDTALLLVPDGWECHRLAFPQGKNRTYAFEIFPPRDHPAWRDGSICERGLTAPRAICVAALKARAQLKSQAA